MNREIKISLRNITEFIKDFDLSLAVGHRQRRVKLAMLITKKLNERKLTTVNLYKMAQASVGSGAKVPRDIILRAFEKLVPTLAGDIIQEVYSKEAYATKEEFVNEI
jgi:hypothetical protein